MADKDDKSKNQKSTELDDLPPNTEAGDSVKGGVLSRPMYKPACTTSGMSTCGVKDTSVNYCDTLSGCT